MKRPQTSFSPHRVRMLPQEPPALTRHGFAWASRLGFSLQRREKGASTLDTPRSAVGVQQPERTAARNTDVTATTVLETQPHGDRIPTRSRGPGPGPGSSSVETRPSKAGASEIDLIKLPRRVFPEPGALTGNFTRRTKSTAMRTLSRENVPQHMRKNKQTKALKSVGSFQTMAVAQMACRAVSDSFGRSPLKSCPARPEWLSG